MAAAEKEATIYVIDLGGTMGDCHHGRAESDLEYAMHYVWDRITSTAAAGRKTLVVGVVGFHASETNNSLSNRRGDCGEDVGLTGYENISVLQNLVPMDLQYIRSLKEKIQPSRISHGGDAISGLVVATHMIDQFTKNNKYNRRIVLVTNGDLPLEDDEIPGEIAENINRENTKDQSPIDLTVLGVDFDDAEYGFKEEDKCFVKKNNERLLRQLVEQCANAAFETMAEAIENINVPMVKPVKPYRLYLGPLTLGDPTQTRSTICLPVERWAKTKKASAPSASTVVESIGGASQSTQVKDEDVQMGGIQFAGVRQARRYWVYDENAPGGKADVDPGELAKGFEYGRTVVHISESDFSITKLETFRMFSIVGFVPMDTYEEFINIGDTSIIVAARAGNTEEAELGFSAFVNALYENNACAIARYVQKDGASPQLLLLQPNPGLEDDIECLYDVQLPFAEDVRSYPFPPLDRVIMANGQVLREHRLLPQNDLNKAMSDYVDAMDLSDFGRDDNGKPAEYAKYDDLYNPVIHRINQAVRQRALHPDEPIKPPLDILFRYSKPPERLLQAIQSKIEELIRIADVKKVPDKSKARRKKQESTPISGKGFDPSLIAKPTRIHEESAISDFRHQLFHFKDVDGLKQVCNEMGNIIRKLIKDSFAGHNYDRATENLRVMREEFIELEEPVIYNDFLKSLKREIFQEKLGGDRREMWSRYIIGGRLNLITKEESDRSEVTEAEAKAFERRGNS